MKQNRIKALKIHKKHDTHTILYQYMMTYFIVLFIPLLICNIYYIRIVSVISNDDVQTRKTELQHASVLVDKMLDEFSYLGDSLAANPGVNSFKRVSTAFGCPNSYAVYKLQTILPDLYQINQSVFDYYIFFDKSETVVNKHLAYTYRDFYNLYLHEDMFPEYDAWYRNKKTNKISYGLNPMKSYVFKKDTSLHMISYIRPLIYGDTNDKSQIQILFKDTVLETLMPTMPDNSMLYIEDFQNRMLYYETKSGANKMQPKNVSTIVNTARTKSRNQGQFSVMLNHEKFLAIRYVSKKTGLCCCMLQPVVVVNRRSICCVIVLVVFILAATAVGLLLSFHMSMKSITPINDILKEVSQTKEQVEDHQSVFLSLKSTFNHLMDTNSDMARTIENQRPFLRNAFLNRLLYGSFTTEEDAVKIAENLGLAHSGRIFGIVIFHFYTEIDTIVNDDLKLIDSCILSLIEVIQEQLPESLCTNLEGNQVILLINMDEKRRNYFREETEQQILKIKGAMPSNISEKFFVYGGTEVEHLTELKDSYNNAVYMFQNENTQIENTVIWYITNAANIPLYPSQDFSVKLVHYVTAGDDEGLDDTLEEIIGMYIIGNNLPVYLQHLLLDELQTILFRIITSVVTGEAEYKKYYDELEKNSNTALLSQLSITLDLFRTICLDIKRKKQLNDVTAIMSSIAAYIAGNYADHNLSLTSVADMFSISEPYLSCIFKQTLGINFFNYIEDVRIDKAKEYLKKSDLSIGEIAEHTGYSSSNSFCRAFKRVVGSSASEYRNNTEKNMCNSSKKNTGN